MKNSFKQALDAIKPRLTELHQRFVFLEGAAAKFTVKHQGIVRIMEDRKTAFKADPVGAPYVPTATYREVALELQTRRQEIRRVFSREHGIEFSDLVLPVLKRSTEDEATFSQIRYTREELKQVIKQIEDFRKACVAAAGLKNTGKYPYAYLAPMFAIVGFESEAPASIEA